MEGHTSRTGRDEQPRGGENTRRSQQVETTRREDGTD